MGDIEDRADAVHKFVAEGDDKPITTIHSGIAQFNESVRRLQGNHNAIGVEAPRDRRRVDILLEESSDALEMLESQVYQLVAELAPICNDDEYTGHAEDTAESMKRSQSVVANRLERQIDRINNVTEGIRRLRQTVEI